MSRMAMKIETLERKFYFLREVETIEEARTIRESLDAQNRSEITFRPDTKEAAETSDP